MLVPLWASTLPCLRLGGCSQASLQFLLLLDFLQPLSTQMPAPYSERVSRLQLVQQQPSKERHDPTPTQDTTGTQLTLLM